MFEYDFSRDDVRSLSFEESRTDVHVLNVQHKFSERLHLVPRYPSKGKALPCRN